MIIAESTVLEDIETKKVDRHCRYFKGKVLEDHKAKKLDKSLKSILKDEDTIFFTDQSTSYVNTADSVALHISEKSNEKTNEKTTKETLKWVYIAISNAKPNFAGTYHKIKKKHLQLYLKEFVYRLNRSCFGKKIFDRLLFVSILTSGN